MSGQISERAFPQPVLCVACNRPPGTLDFDFLTTVWFTRCRCAVGALWTFGWPAGKTVPAWCLFVSFLFSHCHASKFTKAHRQLFSHTAALSLHNAPHCKPVAFVFKIFVTPFSQTTTFLILLTLNNHRQNRLFPPRTFFPSICPLFLLFLFFNSGVFYSRLRGEFFVTTRCNAPCSTINSKLLMKSFLAFEHPPNIHWSLTYWDETGMNHQDSSQRNPCPP